MKICVLNASNPKNPGIEWDVYEDYRTGPYFSETKMLKKAISWHSWAYALKSEFFVYGKDKMNGIYGYDGIIILVNRDMASLIPLVKKLKLMKKKVAIALHEGGQDFQVGSGLPNENSMQRWVEFVDLVKEADFYLNFLRQINPFFVGILGSDKVKCANHSAPFDWDHPFKKKERKHEVLIGTRTLNQRLSRNTLMMLGMLNGSQFDVHYRSEDGDVSELFKRLGLNNIKVHTGSLKYEEWLDFLSNFKVLAHFDQSLNLGQICLDAAMVDVIPVGSTTWNNIMLGTADNGDLETTEFLIYNAIKYYNSDSGMFNLWRFRERLHPDTVGKKLKEAFQ